MMTDATIFAGWVVILIMGVAGASAVWIAGVCVAVLGIALFGGCREHDRVKRDLEKWKGLAGDGEA